MPVTVSHLYIYPIKSFPGIELDVMAFDALGPNYDRRYMLVDDQHRFISQRTVSDLVHARLSDLQDSWEISLPDSSRLVLPKVGQKTQEQSVQIWADNIKAFDQGDAAAEFFSNWLRRRVRLVYIDLSVERRVDKAFCHEERYVGFADGFPVLLVNQNSLTRLTDRLERDLPIERFRPNIVINGLEAFRENSLSRMKSSQMDFVFVKPCSRCVIPTINPKTAEKEKDVWIAMKEVFTDIKGDIYFGQNLVHSGEGQLKRGEELSIQD